MKPIAIATVAAMLAACGCTTESLSRYTLEQIQSSGYMRDATVLNCLAAVAADPDLLPSYAIYSGGSAQVTDSATIGHTITWAPLAYTAEALSLTASRTPYVEWTVHPLVEYVQLEALHAACLWGVYGPERALARYPAILGEQKDYLDQKAHFGVQPRLARLTPGWLHVGSKKEVPACARFKGHRGKTWVWVMPEDSESFAQFTLALQDIATLDPNAGYGNPLLVTLTTYEVTNLADATDPSKATTISTPETRVVKKEYRGLVEQAIQASLASGTPVKISRAQWLAYTDPWLGTRATPSPSSLASRTPSGQLTISGGGGGGTPTGGAVAPGNMAPKATFELRP